MDFVTRAQRRAPDPLRPLTPIGSTQGVKIHYEGTHVPADLAAPDQHHRCAGRVNGIEASHQANTAEGYSAIAYTAIVCPHGTVFEGRGAHVQCAANGNGTLNRAHYAVCAMLGDSGLTEPTPAMLHGLVDAIEWLRRDGGAGGEIKGHRDGYATSCPGEPLYTWLSRGALRPSTTEEELIMDQEARDAFGSQNEMLWGLKNDLAALRQFTAEQKADYDAKLWGLKNDAAAQSATVTTLVSLLATGTGHSLEQIGAAVESAVARAIAANPVQVDVNVHSATS